MSNAGTEEKKKKCISKKVALNRLLKRIMLLTPSPEDVVNNEYYQDNPDHEVKDMVGVDVDFNYFHLDVQVADFTRPFLMRQSRAVGSRLR